MIVVLLILLVLFINAGADTDMDKVQAGDPEVKKIFQEAKRLIYAKEWSKAAEQFMKITDAFPDSDVADDSFYWLSYSLNKLSETGKDPDKTLEIKKEALKSLALLMKRFPGSEWYEEAKLLTMEIAQELAARGLKGYEKYITNGVKEEENADLKAVALATLLEMDKEKAFPSVVKILKSSKDPKLRRNVIFSLAQIKDERVIPLLVEAVNTDPDSEVKKQAVFMLGQMGNPESYKHLLYIYEKATDLELKRQIIFSISQIGGEGSDAVVKDLIHIYQIEKNLELKKQIIFMLGQSQNKEAQAFILKILE